MSKHICGQCGKEFMKEEEYLEHECEVLGRKPTEPEPNEEVKEEK